MEKITIKNFGPVKEAEIEVKDICVLIGHTACGKSTIAKLLAIFNSTKFYCFTDKEPVESLLPLLKYYGIHFPLSKETEIVYIKEQYKWIINQKEILTNYLYSEIINEWEKNYHYIKNIPAAKEEITKIINLLPKELQATEQAKFETIDIITEIPVQLKKYNIFYTQLIQLYLLPDKYGSTYIPAERILMTLLSQAIFRFYDNDIKLPSCLMAFASDYSSVQSLLNNYTIDFLDFSVQFNEDDDYFTLGEQNKLPLSLASTGLQSILPMLAVFDEHVRYQHLIVIEEPELNLYTEVQRKLLEYLVQKSLACKSKLLITTHSPYILSTLQNLLQAGNIAKESKEKAKQIEQIIPRSKWVDYENLTCMFMGADGTCKNILDEEYYTIGINEMDNVSEELSEIYDSLLEIKYHE